MQRNSPRFTRRQNFAFKMIVVQKLLKFLKNSLKLRILKFLLCLVYEIVMFRYALKFQCIARCVKFIILVQQRASVSSIFKTAVGSYSNWVTRLNSNIAVPSRYRTPNCNGHCKLTSINYKLTTNCYLRFILKNRN